MPDPVTPVLETPKPVEPAKTPETVLTPAPVVEPVKAVAPVEPAKPVEQDYSKIELPKDSKLTVADRDALIAQAKKDGRSSDVVQLLLNDRDATIKGYEASEVARLKGESVKWLADLKADKEIGGEALPQNIENAKRVIDKYGDKDFKDFLNNSGLGNHPFMVRMFAKVGKAFGEDHWKDGAPVIPKKDKSAASTLYDKTPNS